MNFQDSALSFKVRTTFLFLFLEVNEGRRQEEDEEDGEGVEGVEEGRSSQRRHRSLICCRTF